MTDINLTKRAEYGERRERFWTTYRQKLAAAREAHPADYPWPAGLTVEAVADRMRTTTETRGIGAVNISGHAWKATARALKIRPTYSAIREYLGLEVRP